MAPETNGRRIIRMSGDTRAPGKYQLCQGCDYKYTGPISQKLGLDCLKTTEADIRQQNGVNCNNFSPKVE